MRRFYRGLRSAPSQETDSLSTVRVVQDASRQVSSREIILYQDDEVVCQMYIQLTNVADLHQGVFSRIEKILRRAFGIDSLEGVSEITLKPVAKVTTLVEAGAEVELKWNLGDEVRAADAVLSLFYTLPKESASSLWRRMQNQDRDTKIPELIYPGKPICAYGSAESEKEILECFQLKDGVHDGMQILLDPRRNKLSRMIDFLGNRRLFVLGIVDDVKPPKIRAGAVILSSRAMFNLKKAS